MLLRDLTIENYRSFDKYRLDNLARVNLLVGDNNCGKTSVLEAVRLFVSGGDISVILDCLERREETAFEREAFGTATTVSHSATALFHSNHLDPDLAVLPVIRLSSAACLEDSVEVSVVEFSGSGTTARLCVEIDGIPSGEIAFNESGRVTGPWGSPGNMPMSFAQKVSTQTYISADGLSTQQLSGMWSGVYRAKRDKIVESTMRIIHPSVGQILPLPQAQQRREILIDIGDERTSLARLGGGSQVLLGVGIALAATKDGVLLIDEIDTGLHYSRLADMWRMVIQTAKDLDVQVFATTHSLDCIRGLAESVRGQEEFTDDVAIFRIDRRTDAAVRFGGEELETVIAHDIEVR